MYISEMDIMNYAEYLISEERARGTVEKYVRDVRAFRRWLGQRPVSRELGGAWRDELLSKGYAPGTINSMLSSVNGFCGFMGWEIRLKFLRVQRRLFRDAERELSRREYERLLETARAQGKKRLALVVETIGATGIRVSELRYITVEAAQHGRADISLKGKIRTILLPGKLCRKLLKYAKGQKTASGEIFLTGSGKSLSRQQIWREMKALCAQCGVDPRKVFPHNLRHLFAVTFYKSCRDIVQLADILGHSSIETTRIYLLTTGAEHARRLERLGLVS